MALPFYTDVEVYGFINADAITVGTRKKFDLTKPADLIDTLIKSLIIPCKGSTFLRFQNVYFGYMKNELQ